LITRDGRVLTEEDLDRMAQEAEAGYDLSTWIRRPGRPTIDASTDRGHSPKIETRVPAAVRDDLARFAAEDGTTVSAVLRQLAQDYVQRRRSRQHS
jgi:hypothetical protein